MNLNVILPTLLLGTLALGSCRSDHDEPQLHAKPKTSTEAPTPTPQGTRGGTQISINLTAEEIDELRSMSFVQTDRPNRADEVTPRLALEAGERKQLYLILVKEGDQASIHRQVLDFIVLSPSDERAGGRTNVLHYTGPVSLPAGYSLNDGNWYAMGILNMDLYNTNDRPAETSGEAGAMVAFGRRSRSGAGQANSATGDHALIYHRSGELQAQTYNIGSIPYLSEWRAITAGTAPASASEPASYELKGLRLRPQGLLLHYEVGVDLAAPMAIRRYGLASNALAFSGYYDLDSEELYRNFTSRDLNTGLGLPEWTEDPIGTPNLSTHHSATHNEMTNLSGAERAFPWDLPTLHETSTPMAGSSYPQNLNQDIAETSTTLLPATKAGQWQFWLTGRGYMSRRSIIFWAMPRKQAPSSPFTYLWAGVYPAHYAQPEGFDPRAQIGGTVVGKLNDYRRELRALELQKRIKEQLGESVQDLTKLIEQKMTSYRAEFERYTADSTRYYGTLQPQFVSEKSISAQPRLVLHQTNQTFSGSRLGRTHHIRSLISSDLMLTEQVYHSEGGRSYALVELYNPTTKPLDLNQYALVRLSANGSKYSYRAANGTLSDDLESCIAGSGLLELKSILRPQVFIGKPTSARGYTVNRGTFSGQKWYTDLWAEAEAEEKPLLPEQTCIIASDSYRELISDNTQPAWWLLLSNRLRQLATGATNRFGEADGLRGVAHSPSHVLQISASEGWALLRKYGSKWQVIDATAPIGSEHLAMASTFAQHQAKLSGLGSTYSLRRTDGVHFPFIPPYRNHRYTADWADDWQATSGWGAHTLGLRTSERSTYDSSMGELQVYYPTWKLERTPLDEAYATYWQNRPHSGSGTPAFSPRSGSKPTPTR